jgi:DNA-binding PadR family transcriptional regulator
MNNTFKNKKMDFEPTGIFDPEVDDIYKNQKKYFKTEKGKEALTSAREAYDKRDPERRRKQKRDYMRRKREKNPDAWKD